MNCEKKKQCIVVSSATTAKLYRFNDISELPEEVQELLRKEEEIILQQTERENRLMQLLETSCDNYSLEDDPDLRKILNPPLWRQKVYNPELRQLSPAARRLKRNIWHRARGNLWSGQRKRQVTSND